MTRGSFLSCSDSSRASPLSECIIMNTPPSDSESEGYTSLTDTPVNEAANSEAEADTDEAVTPPDDDLSTTITSPSEYSSDAHNGNADIKTKMNAQIFLYTIFHVLKVLFLLLMII